MENSNNKNDVSPKDELDEKIIDRFNVWAFLFPFIWALVKKLYMDAFITLALALVAKIALHFGVDWLVLLALVLIFIWKLFLGYDGNREVWRRQNETDGETLQKRKRQDRFAIGGIVAGIIIYIIFGLQGNRKTDRGEVCDGDYSYSYDDFEMDTALATSEGDTLFGFENDVY